MIDENENSQDKLLKKKQVAEMLACCARTVDRMVALGRLKKVRVLTGARFRLSEVQAIMKGGPFD